MSPYIKWNLSKVQRAQIRALTETGFTMDQLCDFYLRNPLAIKRAQQNNYSPPATLSDDPKLLDDTFMAYLKGRDTEKLKAYIGITVAEQVKAKALSMKTKGKRKKKPSPTAKKDDFNDAEADYDDEDDDGEDEDDSDDEAVHEDGRTSEEYAPPPAKKLHLAAKNPSRKQPARSRATTKPHRQDEIIISDDEEQPAFKEEAVEEEDVKPFSLSPSRTTTASPSRNVFPVSGSSLSASHVEPSPRPSSSRSPAQARSPSTVLGSSSTSHSVSSLSVTEVTVSASLRSFLSTVNPCLTRYDVAIHKYGIRTSKELRALRDMPKEHRESTLQRLQEATGMSPFQARTFDVALDNFD